MPPVLERNKKTVLLSQVGYTDEMELQAILARHPELLQEGADAELRTVCREVSIEGQFLDILMVDANGMPVAVEVKLAKNPNIRREVAGQIIEYASLLSSLNFDELDKRSKGDLKKTLQAFAKNNHEDYEELRKNCEEHLREGEFRIIVAVDWATNNLVQIFNFLCRISNLDVRLVEINKFMNNNGEKLYTPNTKVKPDYIKSRELINPFFMGVLNEYKNNEMEGFPLWDDNDCPDWKWVCPHNWRDLEVHYEFIERGKKIGVEIHVEDAKLKSIQELLQSLESDLSERYPDREVICKSNWYGGKRLGLLFPKDTDPNVIAEAMRDIIEETSEKIQEEIERISS